MGDDRKLEPKLWDWPHWAINTTIRCQHRCIYCFEGDRAGMRNVPIEETKELLRRAAREVGVVIFMGAEPTLNRDIVDLTRFATDLGLRVGYSTNALRFADPSFLARCLQAGLRILEVSFHYPDAETYAAITGARPEGFEKLLQAISNIEAANRSRAEAGTDPVPVNVNVVVSAFNVSRLEEVVGHVAGRFSATPWALTFKRVMLADTDPEVAARSRVPLRALREAFARLPQDMEARWGPILAMFRDFPLCALPGHEHQDATLASVLAETRVMHNFLDQKSLKHMYSSVSNRDAPEECARCRFDPWCVSRGLFREVAKGVTETPIPFEGNIPAGLVLLIEACAQVRTTRGGDDGVQSGLREAFFAGGCFWGVEHHFESVPGVVLAESGYMGGDVENPTYRQVCSGRTGHAETVRVVYDPERVSYEVLARLFFEIHDPTQVDRQGPDVGPQYRSAVFVRDPGEAEVIERLIGVLRGQGLEVATRVEPAGPFWRAEEYHQDYYARRGGEPECHVRVRRFGDS